MSYATRAKPCASVSRDWSRCPPSQYPCPAAPIPGAPLDISTFSRSYDLISQDKSLAAQCLQMANSPLFGRWQTVDSLAQRHGCLGFQRISDIAMSCSVLNLTPREKTSIDPVVFWEHSLGCALVCRHFARKISFPIPARPIWPACCTISASSRTCGLCPRSSQPQLNCATPPHSAARG